MAGRRGKDRRAQSATDEVIANVPRFGHAETTRAIEAAAQAMPAWAA